MVVPAYNSDSVNQPFSAIPSFEQPFDPSIENEEIDWKLETAAKALKDKSGWHRITISQGDGYIKPIIVKVQNVFWHFVSLVFGWLIPQLSNLFPQRFKAENRAVIDFLYENFSKERVELVSKRYNLNIEERYQRGMSITRSTFEKVLYGMADTRIEDFHNLFDEVKSGRKVVRHLSEEATNKFRESLEKYDSYEDLPPDASDFFFKVLIPTENVKTLFLNNPPEVNSWIGRSSRPRAYVIDLYRRSDNRKVEYGDVNFSMIALKRILSHVTPEGVMIPGHDGARYVHSKVIKGGANTLFLKTATKPMSDPEQDFHYQNWVMMLSTRSKLTYVEAWRSLLGIFENNIGAEGLIRSYEKIKDLVTDPDLGFIRSSDEKFTISGFSQGATQAERLFCIPEMFSRIERAYLISGPGIESSSCQWFRKLGDQIDCADNKKKITFVTHTRDRIFDAGDRHIGAHCDTSKIEIDYHIIDVETGRTNKKYDHEIDSEKKRPPTPNSWGLYGAVFHSLFHRHSQINHIDDCTVGSAIEHQVLSNQNSEHRKKIEYYLNIIDDEQRSHIDFWHRATSWGAPDKYNSWLIRRYGSNPPISL